ncbi:MAG: decaprenyl-phosphate phosphoribosyltransferase [Flavobacterium sp.]|nr:decaprenyl-phosphate phosphoribosyltransferase [Flavobacterium sp.]
MRNYIKLIRLEQYIKNVFVVAPLFFAGELFNVDRALSVAIAFISFCMAASAIYILNDYFDIAEDREHPVKSARPLASQSVSVKNAAVLGIALLSVSLILSWAVSPELLLIIIAYVILNILYSAWLKHIAILDLNIIAIGFVLRLLAGAAVADIELSVWILLVTYLLALFLALAKRRTDVVLSNQGKEVRKNIKGYNLIFVDIVLGLLSAVLIVCYIFYCISPEVQQHYNSKWLYLSIIFVLNGLLRYLKLALVDQSTYSPTLVILKDGFIQLMVLGWIALMGTLLYFN